MNYKFPLIEHVDQIRAAIAGRDEFIIADRDTHLIANYLVAYEDTFPEIFDHDSEQERELKALRREARGLIFCAKTGEVISRPFHKFFNLNERTDTSYNRVDISRPHLILDKLDGSFIRPYQTHDGVFRIGTKMGETEVAQHAHGFFDRENYRDFAEYCFGQGITPIFEMLTRKQRIVLDYGKTDRLVLLAMRYNFTGNYFSYAEMVDWARQYDIDVVSEFGSADDLEALADQVSQQEDVEGYILRFDNGHSLKIKTQWYVGLHRVKESLNQEKNVVRLVMEDSVDDAKGFMFADDAKIIERFQMDMHRGINQTVSGLEDKFEQAMSILDSEDYSMFERPDAERKKRFALDHASQFDGLHKQFMFRMYDGYDCGTEVRNAIMKKLGNQASVDQIRPLIGGIRWFDYYSSSDLDN